VAIDYERMSRVRPMQKAMLTRAKKRGYDAVRSACVEAIAEWDRIGAWPDDWSNWQRAIDDAAFAEQRPFVRLEQL